MTQVDFAKSLGVSNPAISKLESGINGLSDRMIKTICSLYNVNENWLRTGEGDIFNAPSNSVIDELKKKYDLSDTSVQILTKYLTLSSENRKKFDDVLSFLYNSSNNN